MQYAEINALPQADSFNVKTLRKWIREHISTSLNITGPGRESWGELYEPLDSLLSKFGRLLRILFWGEKSDSLDLVLPRKTRDIDSLPPWVANHLTPFWRQLGPFCQDLFKKDSFPWLFRKKNKNQETLPPPILAKRRYSTAFTTRSIHNSWRLFRSNKPNEETPDIERKNPDFSTSNLRGIIRVTNFMGIIIACLLPIVGIVVLSRLHTQDQVLGYIALFTAIFAIGIMVLTDSRTSRTDIFTAAAA